MAVKLYLCYLLPIIIMSQREWHGFQADFLFPSRFVRGDGEEESVVYTI